MMIVFTAYLLLLLVCSIGRLDAFVVPPPVIHTVPRAANNNNKNKPLRATFLSHTILDSIPTSLTLGDVSATTFDPIALVGGIAAIVLAFGPLLWAARQNENVANLSEEATTSRTDPSLDDIVTSRRTKSTKQGLLGGGGVDRRGTLTTLLGGTLGYAASNMLLGASSSILAGGGSSSSVYGAQWNALYQRIATLGAKHEAAIASPELVSWISKTPAAFANPNLRAWVAAQRAFYKSRQIMGAAAALEEGLTAAAAAVGVAVATTNKESSGDVENDESDEAAESGDREVDDVETDDSDTAVSRFPPLEDRSSVKDDDDATETLV